MATQPPLLFVNSDDGGVIRELIKVIDPTKSLQIADPTKIGELFDSLERQSVSSVGVRNTVAGPGVPSYQTYAGKGVDHGIRETDVSSGALGHAIVQLQAGTAAGMSARKAKYWETRYAPLRLYADFVRAFATRYWVPPSSVAGQLLPILSRPSRLGTWPAAPSIAVNLDYAHAPIRPRPARDLGRRGHLHKRPSRQPDSEPPAVVDRTFPLAEGVPTLRTPDSFRPPAIALDSGGVLAIGIGAAADFFCAAKAAEGASPRTVRVLPNDPHPGRPPIR